MKRILIIALVASAAACKSSQTPPPDKPVESKPVEAQKPVETKKPTSQIGLANQSFQKGDYKAAVDVYDAVLKEEPDNETAQFNRAVALHKSGDLNGAKAAYQAILKKNADDVDASVNLGAILREEGKLEEAIGLYTKALKNDEYNSKLLNNLSVLYRQKKQYAKAIEAIHKLLMRDQRNVDALKNLALVSYDQKKYKLAQTILGNAARMADKAGKKDPDIFVNLGMIQIALGDNGKAMAEFKHAVEIDPKHVVANYNIASLALEHRDYELAAKSYQVVAQAWPDSYAVQTGLGYALQGQQKLDDAAKILEKARGLKEKEALAKNDTAADDEQVVWQLVQIYQNANNVDMALKYADEYLKMKNKTCKEGDADEICGRYNGIVIMKQMKNQPPPADDKKKKNAKAGDSPFTDAPAPGDDAAAAPPPEGGDKPADAAAPAEGTPQKDAPAPEKEAPPAEKK
jgi:tetratricopeptide (TPR) repeat protein